MTEYPYTNDLSGEKSPYLLQHAHNPVNWMPWGDAAFHAAKTRDMPVFLSIGYSSCHWCHVMERESFEDTEVASLLNEHFISIKVDREERPDVDHLYMQACTAMTGQGGWPLSIFLTPDLLPFFAGTYLPKHDQYGMPGLMTVLGRIITLWSTDRNKLIEAGKNTLRYLGETAAPQSGTEETDYSNEAYAQFKLSFDAAYGGFGSAPKFPSAYNLLFLMRYAIAREEPHALQMIKKTLTSMGRGGIYDFVAGGFCRYSTDRQWLVPHFEKMLYGNALLAIAYAEGAAYLDPDYAWAAKRTLDYCIRDMRGEHGGFYTAQDADSEGVEGKYYVWTPVELKAVLGDTDGQRFCKLFNITEKGNFEGKSIPHHIDRDVSKEDWDFAHRCFPLLLTERNKRVQPLTDDKVLTSGNGLMIAALSVCGRLLNIQVYIKRAEEAAHFILTNLTDEGRLLSRWREGHAAHPSTSDDYAYLIWGLIELYQSSHDPQWLAEAVTLAESMPGLFWDQRSGGLFLSGSDVEDLPLRLKNVHDGAVPSGNAVAASNLIRLSRLTGNTVYEDRARAILDAFAGEMASYPMGCAGLLTAQTFLQHGLTEISIVNGEGLKPMLDTVRQFNPFTVVSVVGKGYEQMETLVPDAKGNTPVEGRATAYVCTRAGCRPPVTDPEVLADMLTVPEIH